MHACFSWIYVCPAGQVVHSWVAYSNKIFGASQFTQPVVVKNGVLDGQGSPVEFFSAKASISGLKINLFILVLKFVIVGLTWGGGGGASLHLWVEESKLLQITHFFVYQLKYCLSGQEMQLVPSKNGRERGHVVRYPVVWSVVFVAC